MGILTVFQNATAWPVFLTSSGFRIQGITKDVFDAVGYNTAAGGGWAGSAAAAAAVSAGIDALNAAMNAGVAIGGLAPGASISTVMATAQPFLQGLNVASLAGNVTADLVKLGKIYNSEGGASEVFQEALGRFAFQLACAAAFSAAALVTASALLPVLSAAGLGYVLGGGVYGFMAGEFDALLNSLPLGDLVLYLRDGLISVASPLLAILHDPLVIDLDGDGIELTKLGTIDHGSQTFFDYNGDGFAERTGWVKPDDGILVHDKNGNGIVDNASELFGSVSVDGFEVLELLDSNADRKIDASDAKFAELRIWRDLNGNAKVDAGEMQTLAQAGLASINLARTDLPGTLEGHGRGFGATVTRTNGTTTNAATIYFKTDGQTAIPNITPGFTPAAGVDKLPQLPGSGQINSIAWKASTDATFMADWTALTDAAGALSPDQLQAQFEAMMFRWAGVQNVVFGSRGPFVDAQHLEFLEKFMGTTYVQLNLSASAIAANSPSSPFRGGNVEASYHQVMDLLETMFLSQVARSQLARGASVQTAVDNPYFFYSLLDFRKDIPAGEAPSPTPGNLGLVLDLIESVQPANFGDAVSYYAKSLSGLAGMKTIAFPGDTSAADFATFMGSQFETMADPTLKQIAIAYAADTALIGTPGTNGLAGTKGNDVIQGGGGFDFIKSGEGSDIIVWSKGDGKDIIIDNGISKLDKDILVLTDVASNGVTYSRTNDSLIIKVAATNETITVADFFYKGLTEYRGIDAVKFSDGSELDRAAIRALTPTPVNDYSHIVADTANQDDILWSGRGNDQFNLSTGND